MSREFNCHRKLWTILARVLKLWLIYINNFEFLPLPTCELLCQYIHVKKLPGLAIYSAYAIKPKLQRVYRAKCLRIGYYITLIIISNHILDFPVGICTWQLHAAMCQKWELVWLCAKAINLIHRNEKHIN